MKKVQKEIVSLPYEDEFYKELDGLPPENPYCNVFRRYSMTKVSPQSFVHKINGDGIRTDNIIEYELNFPSGKQMFRELLDVLKWIRGEDMENTGPAREFIMTLVLNEALRSRGVIALPVNGTLDMGKPIIKGQDGHIYDVGVPSTDVVIGYYRKSFSNKPGDTSPFVALCSCNIEAGGDTSGARKLPIHPELQCPHINYTTRKLLPDTASDGYFSMEGFQQLGTEDELIQGISRFAALNSSSIIDRLEQLLTKSRTDAPNFNYDNEVLRLATSRRDKLLYKLRNPIEP